MKAKYNLKYIIITSIFSYILVYFSFFQTNPLVSSDSFNGVLSAKPNVVTSVDNYNELKFSELSFREISKVDSGFKYDSLPPVYNYKFAGSKRILPLMLEEKHGGLSVFLFGQWSKIFGPKYGFLLWHLLFGTLCLYLFIRWVWISFNSLSLTLIASLLFVIDVREYFSFAIFVTEPIMNVFMLICFNILASKRQEVWKLAAVGFILGFGFYIRLNFLWSFIAILVLYFEVFWKNRRIIVVPFIIGALPQFIMMEWGSLANEAQMYAGTIDFSKYFITLARFFTYDKLIVSYFTDINFYQNYRISNLSILSYVLIILGLISFSYFLYIDIKEKGARGSLLLRGSIALLLFNISLLFSLQLNGNYEIYLYPMSLLASFMLGIIIHKLLLRYERFKAIAVTIVAIIVTQLISAMIAYNSTTPVSWHDMKLTQSYIDYANEQGIRSPFTIGVSDVGRYEYVSREQVTPVHLYNLIDDGKFDSFLHVLHFVEKGDFVVPVKDSWSGWYLLWGELKPEEIIKLASINGIEIYQNKFFQREKGSDKILWAFKFKRIAK